VNTAYRAYKSVSFSFRLVPLSRPSRVAYPVGALEEDPAESKMALDLKKKLKTKKPQGSLRGNGVKPHGNDLVNHL
jgi:hypothetical protein